MFIADDEVRALLSREIHCRPRQSPVFPRRGRAVAVRLVVCLSASALLIGCTASRGPAHHVATRQVSTAGAAPVTAPVTGRRSIDGPVSAPNTQVPAASPNVPRSAADPSASPMTTGTSDAEAPQRYAQLACTVWRSSRTQNANSAAALTARAGRLARRAAEGSARWASLSHDMSFVASLPETGNTPAQVAIARRDIAGIASTCAGLNVRFPDQS